MNNNLHDDFFHYTSYLAIIWAWWVRSSSTNTLTACIDARLILCVSMVRGRHKLGPKTTARLAAVILFRSHRSITWKIMLQLETKLDKRMMPHILNSHQPHSTNRLQSQGKVTVFKNFVVSILKRVGWKSQTKIIGYPHITAYLIFHHLT